MAQQQHKIKYRPMIRGMFRKLRSSQPFNYLTTTIIKIVFSPWRTAPEAVIKHLPRTGLVQTRLPNGSTLRLRSRGDDNTANLVFWRGWNGYEPETTSTFFKLAKSSKVVIDVGAHIGYYSLVAALANPEAQVLAFEPLPEAIQRFKQNVRENNLSNVQLFECALADSPGTATLFHAPPSADGIPSSSGLSEKFFQYPFFVESGVTEKTEVPVKTLNQIIEERKIPRVDLIKMDTETTEPSVLEGASEILRRDRPDLIFEVLPGQGTGPAITRQLKPLGYKFYLLRDTGLEIRSEVEDDPVWWNYLARVES
jgi:FkbM family methyltransferase